MSDLDGNFTENNDPIKPTTLRRLMREHSGEDLQVEGDLENVMKGHLENVLKVVWKESISNAQETDGSKVREEDVRAALNEIFYPYLLLEETIDIMDEYNRELSDAADESLLIDLGIKENE